jgi:glycosyltransferase involved in cell wall biosynthesis
MENPLFSIIIPSFNSGKTISSCLDSLVKQSFSNFEVIILDGGSADDTITISLGYTGILRNIRLISEKDRGIYDAMNKGIDMAKGEWMYFLGTDDYLINDRVLENLTTIGDLENNDFVYGNVSSPEYGENYDGPFDQQKILNQNICHQAIFTRKSLFSRLGKFKRKYQQLADYDFNLHAIFNSKVRKKHVDLMIAYYAPAGSSSIRTDEKFIRDKSYLLLKYGFTSFTWTQRIQLCKQIFKQKFSSSTKTN